MQDLSRWFNLDQEQPVQDRKRIKIDCLLSHECVEFLGYDMRVDHSEPCVYFWDHESACHGFNIFTTVVSCCSSSPLRSTG